MIPQLLANKLSISFQQMSPASPCFDVDLCNLLQTMNIDEKRAVSGEEPRGHTVRFNLIDLLEKAGGKRVRFQTPRKERSRRPHDGRSPIPCSYSLGKQYPVASGV